MAKIYYSDYLKLDRFLSCQTPESAKGKEQHDETLFIIVHQAYELWFKQILHELDDVQSKLQAIPIKEESLTLCVDRLERIKKIQEVIIKHFSVLETMTPMDFLEFRNLLIPASGFQSSQFRQIEIILGLKTCHRHPIHQKFFLSRFSDTDKKTILELEKKPSLFELVDSWLSRIPFIDKNKFTFWEEYQSAVKSMLKQDEQYIRNNTSLSKEEINVQLESIKNSQEVFNTLFDEKAHQKLVSSQVRRLSRKATLAALFILLYRNRPILQNPFRFLTALMDIDKNFTYWRHQHALLAKRMLGSKIGTGGSSGHEYLKQAADHNSIYFDIFNLSTFLIPRSQLPILPDELKKELSFYFTSKKS
ncbi:MAG: tryptophan 2,3-dioxygenase family protein [Halobacteriovoraceae bacterium]|nr:tryptophan 2,3-dioxygenase family protein [Halobacteriovoraceae bacterium]